MVTCTECGKTEALRWTEEMNAELRERQMCFTDAYWARMSDVSQRVVTYDFQHFVIGDEGSRSYMRGFGGRRFRVTFHDGEVVWTTNLWGQGQVPEHWRDRFEPNAKVESAWTLREEGGTG